MDLEPIERENEVIARFQAADAEELADLLIYPSEHDAAVLRDYLGPSKFRRLRRLALEGETATGSTRGIVNLLGSGSAETPQRQHSLGHVIVLPGLMGSELTVTRRGEDPFILWLHKWWIFRGYLDAIQLGQDGQTNEDPRTYVRATGAFNDFYGELILTLRKKRDVTVFPYDWRLSLAESAERLAELIETKFSRSAPVHLVTHSMGGLVARRLITDHRDVWDQMSAVDDSEGRGDRVGRLIQLGTPNHGSHLAVQALAGLAETVRKLALLDFSRDVDGIRRIIGTFPGLLQLLPSPEVDDKADRFYLSETYQEMGLSIPQSLLDDARANHETLSPILDPERIVYIAGDQHRTISDVVSNAINLEIPDAYQAVDQGDGTVTHELGLLRDRKVVNYYINAEHSALASNRRILEVLDALLQTGETRSLNAKPESRATRKLEDRKQKAWELEEARRDRVDQFATLVRGAGLTPSARRRETRTVAQLSLIGPDLEIRRAILTGIVAPPSSSGESSAESLDFDAGSIEPIALTVGCIHGAIQDQLDTGSDLEDRPIDAVAVGHYLGVQPSGSELALDRAISDVDPDLPDEEAEAELILTQLTQRGTIRGELAQSFFLRNPQAPDDHRTIAVLGLGPPGRCGKPELTVAVRELTWALGRLGCRHLAAVLIGAGVGNLSIRDALEAWIQGLELSLARGAGGEAALPWGRLEEVTFVEYDPQRVLEIDRDLQAIQSENSTRLALDVLELDRDEHRRLLNLINKRSSSQWSSENTDDPTVGDHNDPIPTRLAVTLQRDPEDLGTPDDPELARYTFSALTDTAAISERSLTLDARLVKDVNNHLAASRTLADQRRWGRTLEELLIPDELADHLGTSAPLVIQLDAASARVHWEMIAQPSPLDGPRGPRVAGLADQDPAERDDHFLGLTRSLTRQLRTALAGPPEPPPPATRLLRLLVIADPAEDEPLPGAQAEGLLLAQIADAFNRLSEAAESDRRIAVETLIGPQEATRAEVLNRILVDSFDILHYAGHCVYDRQFPMRSGWIFSGGTRLTANELLRLDRSPRLVVSNACESGVTPDRSRRGDAKLPATFAEAFFACGVSDFVCTAWPIGDLAAKRFAATFYIELLGMRVMRPESNSETADLILSEKGPQTIHRAMHAARQALFRSADGLTSWGAYQHYGTPYYRAFGPKTRSSR